MLVSAKEMLTKAKAGKYAVGQQLRVDKVYLTDSSGITVTCYLRCI